MTMDDKVLCYHLSYTLAITYWKSGIRSSLDDTALIPRCLAMYLFQLKQFNFGVCVQLLAHIINIIA